MRRFRFSFRGVSLWLSLALALALAAGSALTLVVLLPSAWVGQIAFLGPYAKDPLSAFVTAAVFDFTAFAGLASALKAETLLNREQRIGEAIDKAIADDRNDLARGQPLGYSVEGLQTRFVDAAKFEQPGDSIHARILDEVQDQAANLRYDPVPALVERFAGDFLYGGPRIKVWQSAAVRLGILFTFVGLIQSLVPVQALMGGGDANAALDQAEIRAQVGSIVGGLAIAFGASISGLLSALILQLALGGVSQREQQVIGSIGDLVAKLQYIASRLRNDTVLSRNIQALNASLDEHKREVYNSARLVSEEVMGLAARIADIREAHASVADVLKQQSDAQERAVALAELLSTVDERLAALFDRRLASVSATMEAAAESTRAGIRALGEEIVAEIRGGWGRDARVALETTLAERLDRALTRLDARDESRVAATQRIAARLAVGVGLALLVVALAGAFAVLVRFGYLPRPA